MKNTRRFKFGAMGVALTAVILIIIIALNVGASLLSDRLGWSWDLTNANAFEVSDEILEVFEGIDTPVEVTVLYDEDAFLSSGAYFAQIYKILETASRTNSNITVKYIDPIQYPDIKSQFSGLKLTQGNIVMTNQNSGFSMEVYLQELFITKDNVITASRAEAVLASKMVSITSGNQVEISFANSHNEDAVAGLRSLLELNNFIITDTNTLTGEIDDAVSVLVITAPKTDYTEEEIVKLEDFLFNGGQYGRSIVYFASVEQAEMPNLESFLENNGILVRREVVFERDTNYYSNQEHYVFVNYLESEYASIAITEGLRALIPSGRPLDLLFGSSGQTQTSALLGYNNSIITISLDTQELASEGAALYAAAKSETTVGTGENKTSSSLYVFGSNYIVLDTNLSTPSIGNAEFMIGLFNNMTDNEASIDIAPKSLTGETLNITAASAKTIGAVFIGVIPGLVVVAGIVVFLRRRNK